MMNQTKISDDQGWYTPATFNTVYKLHTEQKKNEPTDRDWETVLNVAGVYHP